MMYVDFTAGDNTYKLRLTTRNIVALEKQIGCNPAMIFGNGDRVPTITEMVSILNASLQALNHGISMNDAYNIFDSWLADGHSTMDFIQVILDIYKVSGIISTDNSEGTEKN